ncbi:MAG: hypothetical protein U0232_10795 [Thermomicrobiales bacterium]
MANNVIDGAITTPEAQFGVIDRRSGARLHRHRRRLAGRATRRARPARPAAGSAGIGLNTLDIAPAGTPPVAAPATTPPSPSAPTPAASPSTARMWVTNFDSALRLHQVAGDGANLGNFAVGGNPVGVAFDGATIWVASEGLTNITSACAPATARASALRHSLTQPPSPSTAPTSVAGQHRPERHGLEDPGKATGRQQLQRRRRPGCARLRWCNIWIANKDGGSTTKLRASDGFNLGTINVGANLGGLAFDGANIWVSAGGAGTGQAARQRWHRNSGTFTVGNTPGAVAFDGQHIWVANTLGNSVTKLKASDGTNLGTFAVGINPSALAFDGSNVWVANHGSNSVSKRQPRHTGRAQRSPPSPRAFACVLPSPRGEGAARRRQVYPSPHRLPTTGQPTTRPPALSTDTRTYQPDGGIDELRSPDRTR